jgi:hypothetical protein
MAARSVIPNPTSPTRKYHSKSDKNVYAVDVSANAR